jgi:ceramide glucosyltransferase
MILVCIGLALTQFLFWFGGLLLAHMFRDRARREDRSSAQTADSSSQAVIGSSAAADSTGQPCSNNHADTLSVRPPLTIFRPLKPGTFRLRPRLDSFLNQLVPGDEVLFGVSTNQIQEGFICRSLSNPQVRIAVIECEPDQLPNPKINKLAQMQAHAGCDRWLLLDSEAVPSARFLGELLHHSSQTTAVTAMYRFTEVRCLSELADAVATLHFLWIGTLWRRCLANQDHLFGACTVVARSMIEQIGGFRRLGNYLADDYHLGRLLHQAGFKIELAAEPVDLEMDRLNWEDFFIHQIRVACTYRTSSPAGYFGSVLAQATPAIVAGMFVSWQMALLVISASVFLRAIAYFFIEQALGGRTSFRRMLLITPMLLGIESIVWSASWFLSRVSWGNRKIVLNREGRIHEEARTPGGV